MQHVSEAARVSGSQRGHPAGCAFRRNPRHVQPQHLRLNPVNLYQCREQLRHFLALLPPTQPPYHKLVVQAAHDLRALRLGDGVHEHLEPLNHLQLHLALHRSPTTRPSGRAARAPC
ncbi:hypothetical protein A0H81_06548 [Grifola frondosa]|uniref:Uncharacterized protein n=1 Tax=Grifola frondosa TaxID=5627 RepID=A0A1C7M9D7_GRIFR|nr:hypothetical protein A0H81_06548 [Grifola frondosa]